MSSGSAKDSPVRATSGYQSFFNEYRPYSAPDNPSGDTKAYMHLYINSVLDILENPPVTVTGTICLSKKSKTLAETVGTVNPHCGLREQ